MKKILFIAAILLLAGIAFGQTLEKGNLMGLHIMTVTPNEGVSVEKYLDFFANELIPKWEENFTGLEIHMLKGIRGENEDNVGLLFLFESSEIRDKYWPDQGQSSELAQQSFNKFQSTWDELAKLGTYSTVHTDWLVHR